MQRVREQVQIPEQIYSVTWRSEPVTVAVLDTGIAYHPDLAGHLLCFRDFVEKSSLPYDDNGHGTHVCGILCGNGELSGGRLRGMAPASKLVVGKVLDGKGEGSCDSMQEAFQWILRVKNRYQIRILNISVGACSKRGMSENSALVKGVNRAWDAGLVVVVAAGNNGPRTMSITTPGISRKVITVGCSDDDREVLVGGNRMVDYSGRGPTAACICKPDLVAPGCSVVSCAGRADKYTIKSGTSMSTPIVSGATALLLERYPDMTNKDVKLKLRESCRDIGLPRNQQGWGLLDVEKLVSK